MQEGHLREPVGPQRVHLSEATCGPAQLAHPTIGNNSSSALHLCVNRPKCCPGSESGDLGQLLGTNPPRIGLYKSIRGNNRNSFHALRLRTSLPTSVPIPLTQRNPHCRFTCSLEKLWRRLLGVTLMQGQSSERDFRCAGSRPDHCVGEARRRHQRHCCGRDFPKSRRPHNCTPVRCESGSGHSPPQCALKTKAGCETVAHILQVLTELDEDATVISVDGIGAFDLNSRNSMMRGLRHMVDGEKILPFVRAF